MIEIQPDSYGSTFHTTPAVWPPLVRFYMTSDLRAATGISRTHLDFYLRERLIVPTARTEGGYLLFDDSELRLLQEIIRQRKDGTPLRQIRNIIDR